VTDELDPETASGKNRTRAGADGARPISVSAALECARAIFGLEDGEAYKDYAEQLQVEGGAALIAFHAESALADEAEECARIVEATPCPGFDSDGWRAAMVANLRTRAASIAICGVAESGRGEVWWALLADDRTLAVVPIEEHRDMLMMFYTKREAEHMNDHLHLDLRVAHVLVTPLAPEPEQERPDE